MKVLIVNNLLDPIVGAGTARKATTLARALEQRGWTVALAAFDLGLDSTHAREALDGLTVHRVPWVAGRFPVPVVRPRTVRAQVGWADVVLLVNHWTTTNLAYAAACLSVGRPYVVMPCGALDIVGRSGRFKRLYNRVAGHRMVRRASGWIATTADEVPSFEPYGVSADEVEVIPNAIDPRDGAAGDAGRCRTRLGLDGRLVLFLGRLASVKGPDILLEAWSRLPRPEGVTLVLAGPEGDAAEAVHARLAAFRPDASARWVGPLDRTAALDACAAADVLVVPSRHEAMSLVALEAGMVGCPVIATTACGFPELADHGGLLAAVEPDALADALATSLAWSSDERTARGAALRDYISTHHTWDALTPRYETVLRAATRRRMSS
jgi:glycosyltransferase involved in cell wall biosynthesis